MAAPAAVVAVTPLAGLAVFQLCLASGAGRGAQHRAGVASAVVAPD